MVSSEGQLLAWALDTYGGITSYSELQDPRRVQLYLGEGDWGWGLALGGMEWAGMIFLFQKGDNLLGQSTFPREMPWGLMPRALSTSPPTKPSLTLMTLPPTQMPRALQNAFPRSTSMPFCTLRLRSSSMG